MKKQDHLPSLDGIRGLCIAMVLGSHAAGASGFPADWVDGSHYAFNGNLGVLVFFVLSGFLITYLIANEEQNAGRISLANFYVRRCIRILPVYAAFLLGLAALEALTPLVVSRCQFLTAATFTKNFGCASWVDGHLWSLSVEEQFYILWPTFFALAPIRWRWYAAVLLVALAPVFRVGFYVAGWHSLRSFSFMTNMDSLMMGCAAGLAVSRYPEAAKAFFGRRPMICRLAAAGLIYAVWLMNLRLTMGRFTVPFGSSLQAACAAYLIASYVTHEQGWGFRLLNWSPLRYLGVLSYSIYIWQQPFFASPAMFGAERVTILSFPFNFAAAIALAAVSYHAFEKPVSGLRQRFRTRASKARAVPGVDPLNVKLVPAECGIDGQMNDRNEDREKLTV